jgi:hypothetical protein
MGRVTETYLKYFWLVAVVLSAILMELIVVVIAVLIDAGLDWAGLGWAGGLIGSSSGSQHVTVRVLN